MIKQFYDLSSIKQEIESDRMSNKIPHNRYPIRLIFLNSFENLLKLTNFIMLYEKNIQKLELSELLTEENYWLTRDEIINKIKEFDTDLLIIGLSEFLRFTDKEIFYTMLKTLTEIEAKSKNIRIYIPFVGLKERFNTDFWNNFYRNQEWAPIWELIAPSQNIVIYHLKFDLSDTINLDDFTKLKENKDWFNLWKKENISKIISFNNALEYFYTNFLPDQIFELKLIENIKDFLESILGLSIPFKYIKKDNSHWKKLLKISIEQHITNLEDSFKKIFNIYDTANLTNIDFFKLYLDSDNKFKKWFLTNYILFNDENQDSYIYLCFNKLRTFNNDTLLKNIWFKIFDFEVNEKNQHLFVERKNLLDIAYNYFHKFNLDQIEINIPEYLNNIKNLNFKTKSFYLTNITKAERKFIIESILNENISDVINIIKEIYPELVYYLDWHLITPDNNIEEWIIDYFYSYNISKLLNSKETTIDETINRKNKNIETFSSWYYSMESVNTLLNDNDDVVWVDALGAEWFPLFIHLLEKYGKEKDIFVKEKNIKKVNIPTTTECNKKDFFKFGELDNYIHSQNSYKYPDALIDEIEIIKKLAKKIIELTDTQKEIISDHGFTFLCTTNFGNFKRLNFTGAEHDGRCMKIESENYHNDAYFINWNTDEGNCNGQKHIIALKHISLNNTPAREVHGGATPEEVLVPQIVIQKISETIDYVIEPNNFEISTTKPEINFKISPKPMFTPKVYLFKKQLTVKKIEDRYSVDLKNIDSGNYTLKLTIGDKHYNINVQIKGGITENVLF